MTVVYWTADWLSLDVEAQHQVRRVALRNPAVSFLRCSVDDLADKARAFAVHDLPAFHVFDGHSLVERLHGLSSIASIEDVLEHYTYLKHTDADTCSPASSIQTSWIDDSLAGSIPHSPLCNSAASEVSTTNCSCDGSHDSNPRSAAAPGFRKRSSRTLQPSMSNLSNMSVYMERSYLPQYTRTLSNPRKPAGLSLQGSILESALQ